MTIDEAISTVTNDKPESYEGKCIQPRDLAFLENAKTMIE